MERKTSKVVKIGKSYSTQWEYVTGQFFIAQESGSKSGKDKWWGIWVTFIKNMGANWKYRKLDLPIFNVEDPDGWIMKAE